MDYAIARVEKLAERDLIAMSRHGRGEDVSSQERRRPDARVRAVYLRREVHPDDGVSFATEHPDGFNAPPSADLVLQHREHLKREDAGLRRNAAVALHCLLGVSPDWFGNQRFDPRSPKVTAVLEAAVQFAEQHIGGVFSARFDVDELSGGVVDVFCAPIHENARSGKRTVSTRKSIQALGAATGHAKKPLRGLQDAWHKTCVEQLDRSIERGALVEKTERRHLTVAEFYREQDMMDVAERAKWAIETIRRRWRQRALTQAALNNIDGDPLMRMLDAFVEPDLDQERYDRLRRDIDGQLAYEREQSRGPRGPIR